MSKRSRTWAVRVFGQQWSSPHTDDTTTKQGARLSVESWVLVLGGGQFSCADDMLYIPFGAASLHGTFETQCRSCVKVCTISGIRWAKFIRVQFCPLWGDTDHALWGASSLAGQPGWTEQTHPRIRAGNASKRMQCGPHSSLGRQNSTDSGRVSISVRVRVKVRKGQLGAAAVGLMFRQYGLQRWPGWGSSWSTAPDMDLLFWSFKGIELDLCPAHCM